MNGKHYKLRFLPLFEDDLSEIVDYIAYRLKNPIAADQLVMPFRRPSGSAPPVRKPLSRIIRQRSGNIRTTGST